ncbi:hypothetical protein BST61_g3287 [Cercospora zeina]
MLASPPPTPQRPAASDKILDHLRHISDFDTGGRVTDLTRLATLCPFNHKDVDGEYLRTANGKSEPRLRAQMLVKADDKWTAYPPSVDVDYKYEVWVRFHTLYSAPALRIEIELSGSEQAGPRRSHTVALEYPFNNRDGKQIRDFMCDLNDGAPIIRFEANGCTSEGYTTVDRFSSPLLVEQEMVLGMIEAQRTANTHFTIVISVEAQEVANRQRPTYKVLERCARSPDSLLPSIGCNEWDDFLPNNWQAMDAKQFLRARPSRPNLMLMQDCGLTFSSIAHFCAVNLVAETIANEEGSGKLRLWARADHQVTLHELKGHLVLAIKFGDPIVLPSGRKITRHPKIPNDLEIKIVLSDGRSTLKDITACHERDLMGLHRHTRYDACFKVTSHSLRDFQGLVHRPDDPRPVIWRVLSLDPHVNRFWAESVLQTARILERDAFWHPFMLGQSFKLVEKVDFIAALDVDQRLKASAKQCLHEAKQWNSEQRRAIDSVDEPPGRLVVLNGFPGTGKTTVLLATAVYFVKLGGRALVSAAENGHVENMAIGLDLMTQKATRPDGTPIEAYIVQSLSRGKSLRDTNTRQATHNTKGHIDGSVGGLDNFIFAVLVSEGERDQAWKYTLCVAVANKADRGESGLIFCSMDPKSWAYGRTFNAWKRLRQMMQQVRLDTFPWDSEPAVVELREVYIACERKVISRADIMITTVCNARSKELRYWSEFIR